MLMPMTIRKRHTLQLSKPMKLKRQLRNHIKLLQNARRSLKPKPRKTRLMQLLKLRRPIMLQRRQRHQLTPPKKLTMMSIVLRRRL